MSEQKRKPQPITWPVVAALTVVCATVVAVAWLCFGWAMGGA